MKHCPYSKPSTPKKRKILVISDPENGQERQTQASATMARILERYKEFEKSLLQDANEVPPDLVRDSSVWFVCWRHMLPFFSFLCFEPENLQVVNVYLSEPTYSDEKLVIESSAIMSLQDDR